MQDVDIPPEQKLCVEQMVTTLLHYTVSPLLGPPITWIRSYDRNGIKVTRSVGFDVVCVRGETLFPHSMIDVIAMLNRLGRKHELDPLIEEEPPIHWLTTHFGVQYTKYRAVWPASARDLCNFIHWRVLPNGDYVQCVSTGISSLYPERPQVVRGIVKIGGIVMTPVSGGTYVFAVAQVRLYNIQSHVFRLYLFRSILSIGWGV
jgi:hypothetical protein